MSDFTAQPLQRPALVITKVVIHAMPTDVPICDVSVFIKNIGPVNAHLVVTSLLTMALASSTPNNAAIQDRLVRDLGPAIEHEVVFESCQPGNWMIAVVNRQNPAMEFVPGMDVYSGVDNVFGFFWRKAPKQAVTVQNPR